MAIFIHDDVFDDGLNGIKNNCDKMVLCSSLPTTYAEAVTTYALADVAMSSGDFTIADGDVSGRKLTVAEKTGISVDTSGTGSHVALVDTINSKLYLATEEAGTAVDSAGTVDIPTWKIEVADPTAS